MSTQEVGVNSQQAAEAARTNFNFLAALAMPEDYSFPFPLFYLTLFALLTSFKERIERYAIGIPRGFAKSTFAKLLCVWYILFSHKQFILIVGAAEDLAVNFLSDVCDMLDSPNIRKLFGNWKAHIEVDQQHHKVFYFRGRQIILRSVGANTSVRGINRKNKRPDVIIMDDVQKREDAENKELSDKLLRWVIGTLMKTKSNNGCTYIYIGNMYPQNCILEKLKNNRQWTSMIVGGILADGTSLWPDLKPIDELVAEYESDTELGHPEIFLSEVLNSTEIALASGIDISRIPFLPDYYKGIVGEGSFILIDPSAGKKTSDDLTIEHYEVIDGKPILDEILHGTFTPLETIKKALEVGIRRNTRAIFVEDVAYQGTLLFWFEQYCEQQAISGFEFNPTSPKGRNKNNRIKKGLVKLVAGEILLHPTIRSLVVSQIVDWNPLKQNNRDDIIDPIGYVEEVMQEYPDIIVRDIFDLQEDRNLEASHSSDLALPF